MRWTCCSKRHGLVVAICLGQAFLLLYLLQATKYDRVETSIHIPDRSKLHEYIGHSHHRHAKLAEVKVRSSIYNSILSKTDLYDFLAGNSFDERCERYFYELSKSDPAWIIDPNKPMQDHRKAFTNPEDFLKQEQKEAAKAEALAKSNGKTFTLPTEEQLRQTHSNIKDRVSMDEQTVHDYVAHLRVYDKCFLNKQKIDQKHAKKQQKHLAKYAVKEQAKSTPNSDKRTTHSWKNIENRLLSWLTGNYPTFTRWNGKNITFRGITAKTLSKGPTFLKEFKSRLNGRGIVLTLSDKHVDNATRLIHLLRYFDNTYPIQVVFFSDLSKESRIHLVRASRDEFRGYRVQEIWFVDAGAALEKNYWPKFRTFGNKLVATMFNSFSEILLCDADSVLLVSPKYFFENPKYVQTGTLFFKDRVVGKLRPPTDIDFFKALLPSMEDSAVFGVSQSTGKTLDNNFFTGSLHYMESGIVAINRKKHFSQVLMMITMSFYQSIRARMYGEKELFWLAFPISGSESYAFNNNGAAAVGELTPEKERHKDIGKTQSFRSKEICSAHPAHISDSDNQTLIWLNSGFRHCGNSMKIKMRWGDEFKNKHRYTNLQTLDEFKTFFRAPMEISHGIIPPYNPELSNHKNNEHEPERPWATTSYCHQYTWCTWSSIGGNYVENGVTKSNVKEGILITFTKSQKAFFKEAGDVWMAGFDWEDRVPV